mmetsp:Transcript_16898/g.59008  ORF Transcript_16898/g.59008 Transcript_16898/m.59008 type:complete len:274 (+) Transcript_16898:5636-6457(+)
MMQRRQERLARDLALRVGVDFLRGVLTDLGEEPAGLAGVQAEGRQQRPKAQLRDDALLGAVAGVRELVEGQRQLVVLPDEPRREVLEALAGHDALQSLDELPPSQLACVLALVPLEGVREHTRGLLFLESQVIGQVHEVEPSHSATVHGHLLFDRVREGLLQRREFLLRLQEARPEQPQAELEFLGLGRQRRPVAALLSELGEVQGHLGRLVLGFGRGGRDRGDRGRRKLLLPHRPRGAPPQCAPLRLGSLLGGDGCHRSATVLGALDRHGQL